MPSPSPPDSQGSTRDDAEEAICHVCGEIIPVGAGRLRVDDGAEYHPECYAKTRRPRR
jgi:ribosomal protein L24E